MNLRLILLTVFIVTVFRIIRRFLNQRANKSDPKVEEAEFEILDDDDE